MATIPFAHARKALEKTGGQEHIKYVATASAYTRSSTPCRLSDRQKAMVAPSSASSRGSRSSNMLHELDTSERALISILVVFIAHKISSAVLMRATINRLLTFPDFAGLSQTSSQRHKSREDKSIVAICEDAACGGVYALLHPRARVTKGCASLIHTSDPLQLGTPSWNMEVLTPISKTL